jgi:prevent-host-death family protein
MEQSISMADAKSKLSELVGQAAFGGRRFVLQRRGQPMAVLIGVEEYRLLQQAQSQAVARFSSATHHRQEQLLEQAKRLQAEWGDPLAGLADLMRDLPSQEDEFWLQIAEI